MKKLFLLIAIVASVCAREPKFANVQDALIFISPPRSGTHVTNLALQLYTHRPYYRYENNMFQNVQHCDIRPNFKKRPYFHTHFAANLAHVDKASNQLLLLMRNPKELAIRYTKGELLKAKIQCTEQAIEENLLNIERYHIPIHLLKAFNEWHEDKRLLITYEDMLSTPQKTIERILAFLDEPSSEVKSLLPTFERHKKQLIKNYEKTFKAFGGSMSKGQTLDYHTQNISLQILIQADDMLKQTYPHLWEKYLSRYATKSEIPL